MLSTSKRTLASMLVGVALVLGILGTAGCSSQQGNAKDIKLVYVEWSSAVASTNVVKAVLESQGYHVTALPVSAAAMWQAVASGDADAMVAAWLPTTHAQYYAKTKNKVVNLGPNFKGTRIGLVVPDYVSIDSIDQLEAHAKKFDGKIIGIDPGAGIMSKTQQVLKDYDLKDFTLVQGSGATMTAALSDAIRNHQWIVVTGWTPHWMFARWKLKYLNDPKKVYGTGGNIDTIVRKGLKKDAPTAYYILNHFHWSGKDMEEVMNMNRKQGSDPYTNARQWIKDHPKVVQQWLPSK
ncbi:MAG TPA: glycine betaine ABC transporter substrate-binding protein [Gammaproteobacteria bacterium]|nr:glycine betaine ABC transporter substrate-binding protein [Gammaproteobacteria bacterium]